MRPVDVVQRQLDAYNARDLAAFVVTFADDVRIYRLPGAYPVLDGKAALAEHYRTNRFVHAGLRADLLARIELGGKVLDHERIHGVRAEPFEAVAIYEVAGGRIRTVWFVDP